MSVPQRIAITGASGLIGTALVGHLKSEGHTVQRFVRRPVVAPDEIQWDPKSGYVDIEALRGVALSVGKVFATAAADLWGVKVKKGVVTKMGADKYERAIREVELLKSTGKRGPGKRKKAKEDEKEGLDGAEDPGLKKKSKKKKGVESELSLDDLIYKDFCWAKWQGKVDSKTSLLDFRKVWTPSHPRIGVGGGGDVGD